jgi:hypothetical protein
MAQLIKEVDFRPIDKFVVTFDKFRTHPAPFQVVDKEKSTEETTVTKIVKKATKYNHQVAIVVASPDTEDGVKNPINAGDKIVVDFRACMPLDGYDNLYMIPKYNVLGVVIDKVEIPKNMLPISLRANPNRVI